MIEPEIISEYISEEDIDHSSYEESGSDQEFPEASKMGVIFRSTGFGFRTEEFAIQAIRELYVGKQEMDEGIIPLYPMWIVFSLRRDVQTMHEGIDFSLRFALGVMAYHRENDAHKYDLFIDRKLIGVWREEQEVPTVFNELIGGKNG